MEFMGKDKIKVDRELSDLDLFVLDFVDVLKNHGSYVIVGGYVSILLGRSRSSEDVDLMVPRIGKGEVEKLVSELVQRGFYCLNAEKPSDVYDYLSGSVAIRFAKKNSVIPNVVVKFAKNKIDEVALNRNVSVLVQGGEIIVSNLEMQISFKENVLKSPKDMEDAGHIRCVAKGHLDYDLIELYKRLLNDVC